MNINTHLKNRQTELLSAFSCEKETLLKKVKTVLLKSKELLKPQYLDFWIKQLNEISFEEIPTTSHALLEEKNIWENILLERASIIYALENLAENIITFSVEDDLCKKQGQFHYYYDIEKQDVFAESELGSLRSDFEINKNIRIAKISELKMKGIIESNTLLLS